MKKYAFFLIIFFVFFTACNLQIYTNPTPVPNADRLATVVSNTLTAKPVLPTSIPPTSIKKPSDTSTLTVSPSATQTATLTMTPTATPESFKKSLGTPVWQNHLDNGKAFGIDAAGYQNDTTQITVNNGYMTLSSTGTNGYRSWRLVPPTPTNFYLEAAFKTVACSGGDQYGLVFRSPDYSSGFGYYFGLTCSGTYSLYKWSSSGNAVIYSGNSPLILAGNNQTNRLGIKAVDNNFTFYMNDKEMANTADASLPEGGHIGVFVGAYSGNLVVQMDDISYWDIH